MNTITIVTLFTLWLVLWKQQITELLHNQLIFRTVNYLDMKSCLLKKLFSNAKYLQAERLESQVFIQTRSDVQPIEMLGWFFVPIAHKSSSNWCQEAKMSLFLFSSYLNKDLLSLFHHHRLVLLQRRGNPLLFKLFDELNEEEDI